VKYNLRHRAPEATAAPGEEHRRGADAPQRLLALAPPRRAAGIGPRPSTNVARSHRSPRAQRPTGAGKSGSRLSWSARCLLTPRISAISTTRRSLRRVTVRSIREVATAARPALSGASTSS
jgi:hypothetical protein